MAEELQESGKSKKLIIILAVVGIFVILGIVLILFVALFAGLFSFGVYNPPADGGSSVAGRCIGMSRLAYVDSSATSSEFSILLGNGSGSTITITEAEPSGDFAGGTADYDSGLIGSGGNLQIDVDGLNLSGTYSGSIKITYEPIGALTKTETITCTGSV